MVSTHQEQANQRAAALLAEILPVLREALQPPWREGKPVEAGNDEIEGRERRFYYPNWNRPGEIWCAVDLAQENRMRWGRTEKVELTIARVERRGMATQPRRAYLLTKENWRTELTKAIALIQKRTAMVDEWARREKEEDEQQASYEARLLAKLAAANLPLECWAAPHWWASRTNDPCPPEELLLIDAKPGLVGEQDELFLRVSKDYEVTAEQAARIYALCGKKMKLRVDASLTPAEFIELRKVLREETS